MKVICITQARMGSSRLPGKVLQRIHGRPMLDYHLLRVKQAKLIDAHIIATTAHDIDKPIVEFCKHYQQKYFCGDEQDVLGRFYFAALDVGAQPEDIIVRLTGDCPLISAELVDDVISIHKRGVKGQYTHVSLDFFPRGFDCEVFTMAMLEDAYQNATTQAQREHVTLYLYTQSANAVVPLTTGDALWRQFRLCVDEPSDMRLVEEVLKQLGNNWLQASPKDICQLLLQDEQLASINKEVRQRTTH
ncbi:glycosyltransferase family protein [Alteromonas sp. 5E99-2]|uniref:cytidylyltransferase domain-containing protein n=1 Tax=Alteromonas sp. 5E99-2 TaxID=2817683 RepID=UPI001A99E497|nr:glycosyltransferase family protein [Alteromonas sp. 5E99-2]MBO1256007.1 glycosyltransferase family protein [Alteromonas sp. 5E99-2]